jgi:hypothetical protein
VGHCLLVQSLPLLVHGDNPAAAAAAFREIPRRDGASSPKRASWLLLRPGQEPLLPHPRSHPRRRHPPPCTTASCPTPAAPGCSSWMQEDGEAARAGPRQGDVRRRGHLLQQEEVHLHAPVPVRPGVSTHGCLSFLSLWLLTFAALLACLCSCNTLILFG